MISSSHSLCFKMSSYYYADGLVTKKEVHYWTNSVSSFSSSRKISGSLNSHTNIYIFYNNAPRFIWASCYENTFLFLATSKLAPRQRQLQQQQPLEPKVKKLSCHWKSDSTAAAAVDQEKKLGFMRFYEGDCQVTFSLFFFFLPFREKEIHGWL